MFWVVLIWIVVIVSVLCIVIGLIIDEENTLGVGLFILLVGGFCTILPGLVGSGTTFSLRNDANSAYTQIEVYEAQRTQLVNFVMDEMDAKEYREYLDMTDSEKVVVLLRDRGASDVLITKITMVVDLNKSLFDLRNKALKAEIDLCNHFDNSLNPYFPFIHADCRIDMVTKLQTEVNIATGS